MLNLAGLTLSQLDRLSLIQLGVLPIVPGASVYATRLQSVAGFTSDFATMAAACCTTRTARVHYTTAAAASAQESA